MDRPRAATTAFYKFMDAIGVELEQSDDAEVIDDGVGWSPGKSGADLDRAVYRLAPPADGLRTRLGLLPLLPAAIRFDRRVEQDTPKRVADVGMYLSEHTVRNFPVLASCARPCSRRSIASILHENFDPDSSVIGMDVKVWLVPSSRPSPTTSTSWTTSAPASRASVDADRLHAACRVRPW